MEYCTESGKVVYVLVWKELLDDMVKLKKKGSKTVFKYNITFFWKININVCLNIHRILLKRYRRNG